MPFSHAPKIQKKFIDYIEANYPLRRLTESEDCANLILFLASEYASFITGTTNILDGGSTLTGANWEAYSMMHKMNPTPLNN